MVRGGVSAMVWRNLGGNFFITTQDKGKWWKNRDLSCNRYLVNTELKLGNHCGYHGGRGLTMSCQCCIRRGTVTVEFLSDNCMSVD